MASHNAQPLKVTTETVGEVTVVIPVGEVDIASVKALQDVLREALDSGRRLLVVDLEGLDYLDSTGLGCVTASRREAREAGGDLVLVCTRPRVLRLFTITGLDQLFTVYRQRHEAVAKLAGDAP